MSIQLSQERSQLQLRLWPGLTIVAAQSGIHPHDPACRHPRGRVEKMRPRSNGT